ncbi:MAG: phenylalanine--tRNA ligase subunit alpha [Actinomycetes bacterium]
MSPDSNLLSEDSISQAVEKALADIKQAKNLEDLKNARLNHAGEKSPVALANREIGSLDGAAKAEAGKRIGEARNIIKNALEIRTTELQSEREDSILVSERVDVTQVLANGSTSSLLIGSRHPLTTIAEQICDVFIAMGYEVAEGPEAEAEWFNFDSLNISEDHPSRSSSDTFYVESLDSGVVLRTQTSPVQMRTMLERKPPIYVIAPGKVFRTDELDATHTPVFHQVEGLAVDKNLTMANLKGTLDHLARTMFGDDIETRFRPSYFPFTEPSAELDLKCFVCKGESKKIKSCKTCRGEGWIEWGGCGMVNPNVLETAGIDSKKYSGFAFGMGLERTLMFKYGVTDMHDLVEADLRFTKQFGLGI